MYFLHKSQIFSTQKISVRTETPVVSELWGATQQPWGKSLGCIGKSGEAIYDTPWGRSLEKQLRSSTMGVTLHIN